MITDKAIIKNSSKITCAALNEDKEVISYHSSLEDAIRVEGVAYVRPASLEWYDITYPEDEEIRAGEAWREDLDLAGFPEDEHPRDWDGKILEHFYPALRIEFGADHAFMPLR